MGSSHTGYRLVNRPAPIALGQDDPQSDDMYQGSLRHALRHSVLVLILFAYGSAGIALAADDYQLTATVPPAEVVSEPFTGSLTLNQFKVSPNPMRIQGNLKTVNDQILQLESDPFLVQFALIGPQWLSGFYLENRLLPSDQLDESPPAPVIWRVNRLQIQVFGVPIWEQQWPHCQSSQPLTMPTKIYARSLTASIALNNFTGCGRFGTLVSHLLGSSAAAVNLLTPNPE